MFQQGLAPPSAPVAGGYLAGGFPLGSLPPFAGGFPVGAGSFPFLPAAPVPASAAIIFPPTVLPRLNGIPAGRMVECEQEMGFMAFYPPCYYGQDFIIRQKSERRMKFLSLFVFSVDERAIFQVINATGMGFIEIVAEE